MLIQSQGAPAAAGLQSAGSFIVRRVASARGIALDRRSPAPTDFEAFLRDARLVELLTQPPPVGAAAVHGALLMLWRYRLLFTLVAFCVGGTAAAVILHLSPAYFSMAMINVRPEQADPLAPVSAGPAKLDDRAVDTQVDILRSRAIARDVVKALGLGTTAPVQSWPEQLICDVASRLSLCTPSTHAPSVEERVDNFLKQLKVWPPGASAESAVRLKMLGIPYQGPGQPRMRTVGVGFVSPDPVQAAAVPNMIVTLVQQQQIASQTESLRRITDWFDARTHNLSGQLGEAEAKAGAFRSTSNLNGRTVHNLTTPLVADQIASAAAEYSQAQAQLAAAEARASRVAGVKGGTQRAIRLLDEPLVVAASATLTAISSQRALLAQSYGDRYPPLASLNNQVGQAERKLAVEVRYAVAAMRKNLAKMRDQVARLGRNLTVLRTQGNTAAAPVGQLKTLDREAASAGTIYQTFLARTRKVVDRSSLLQPSIEFVTHAEVPSGPFFPSTNRLLAGAALLGLLSGVGAVFGRSFLPETITVGEGASQQLALPLLASVPFVSLTKRLWSWVPRHVVRKSLSTASEAIRSLVANLTLAHVGHDGMLGSIVVTSTTGEEGKSTLCLWLAEAVEKTGKPVLVIDGDHRNGSLHRMLHKAPGPGLTEWISGQVQMKDVLQIDEVSGLDFISAGAPISRPFSRAELARLQSMLDRVKQQYGIVVVDSPPMLAMADALLYARLVDRTVMVCRWKHTSRAAVQGCLDRLRNAGVKMAGLVLSMVDASGAAQYGDGVTRRDIKLLERYNDS